MADERDADAVREAGFDGPLLTIPDESLYDAAPAPAADLAPDDPALITFTSGTAGEPKPIRHGQRYLTGQRVQAEHWFGARDGDLAWCTAASGWSKSARNVFIAPWLMGATALLHDARFDPEERLDVAEREGVNVLCMAPTEYRAIAKRTELRELPALRHAVAAGEPLNPEVVAPLARRRRDRDPRRLRPDRDRRPHRHADRPARPARARWACPSPASSCWIDDGELCVDPATVPTFFLDGPRRRAGAPATASARTRTATSGSRAAPTT